MILRLSAFLTTVFLVAALLQHRAGAFEATALIGTTCELKLELVAEHAPLRVGGSCPGAPGTAHVTLGIGGWF